MKQTKLETFILTAWELIEAIEAMGKGEWHNGKGIGYIHSVTVINSNNFVVTVKRDIEP